MKPSITDTLVRSWKFSLADIYTASDQDKDAFLAEMSSFQESQNVSDRTEEVSVNENLNPYENEYDRQLIAKYLGQQKRDKKHDRSILDDGDKSDLHADTSGSSLLLLKREILPKASEENPSRSTSMFCLDQMNNHIKQLQEKLTQPEQCPDQQLSTVLSPKHIVGLSSEDLTKKYDDALQQGIRGHHIELRLPQAHAFMQAHQSFTNAVATLMPYARSNLKLSQHISDVQAHFQNLSESCIDFHSNYTGSTELLSKKKENLEKSFSLLQSSAMALHNHVSQSDFDIKADQNHKDLHKSSLDLEQVFHGLHEHRSTLQEHENSFRHKNYAEDISLDDLEDRAKNISSVMQNIHKDYFDAENQESALSAYTPFSEMEGRLSSHQLSDDSLNYQLMNCLDSAIAHTEQSSYCHECPDFNSEKAQNHLQETTRNLMEFGAAFEPLAQSASQAMGGETASQVSEQLNSVNDTVAKNTAEMNQRLQASNDRLANAVSDYNNSASKLSEAQGQLQAHLMDQMSNQGVDPQKMQADLLAKQAQAEAALAEARAKYQALLDQYNQKLAQLQAMAAKLKAELQAKLDLAQSMVDQLTNKISSQFCGKDLKDLFHSPDSGSMLSSLPPTCQHAIGAIASMSQKHDQAYQPLPEDEQSSSDKMQSRQEESDSSQSESIMTDSEKEQVRAQMDQIQQHADQSQAYAQDIMDHNQAQVESSINDARAQLDQLMGMSLSEIQHKLERLDLQHKELLKRFPSCPYSTDTLNKNHQLVLKYLGEIDAIHNMHAQVQEGVEQLQGIRDQALGVQSNINNLQGNAQNLKSPQAIADEFVQMNAPQIPQFPPHPTSKEDAVAMAMQMANLEVPQLPDLQSLVDIQLVIPKLSDMLNQVTEALSCAISAYGIVDASGAEMLGVSSNAQIKCMMGGPPMPLSIVPFGVNLGPGKPATLPINMIPFLNVKPFTPCTNPANPLVIASLGAPSACMPLNLPWMPLALKTKGMQMPLVRENSQMHCAFTGMTGMTTVMNPGQAEIKVA